MVAMMANLRRRLEHATVLACGLALCVVLCDPSCDDSLQNNKVIPEYADEIYSTNITLCSEYTKILCGENYAPSLLEKRPTCYYTPRDDCEYLAVLFFGKYEDSNRTGLLWLEYNIPAQDLRTGFTGEDGNEMVIYKPPKTSNGGPAGHVFFVYCPNNGKKTSPIYCTPEERNNFDVKKFAKEHNFGNPVAGIFFKVTATGQLMNSTTYSKRDNRRDCPK